MKYRISTHKQAQPNMCSPLVHSYITINLPGDRSRGGATVRPPSSSFTSLSEGGESECEGVAVGGESEVAAPGAMRVVARHGGGTVRWRFTAGGGGGGAVSRLGFRLSVCAAVFQT
jgi:hypothetical protein